jgi:hypothetical protein
VHVTAIDVTGPIRAFRVWVIDGDRLRSPYVPDHVWQAGVNGPVRCRLGPRVGGPLIADEHTGPTLGCACGIYADPEFVPFDRCPGLPLAYGIVSAWGEVHWNGRELRAQYATLRLLASADSVGAAAERLAVPVVSLSTLRDAAVTAGRSMSELVGSLRRPLASHRGWIWPEAVFRVAESGERVAERPQHVQRRHVLDAPARQRAPAQRMRCTPVPLIDPPLARLRAVDARTAAPGVRLDERATAQT